MSEARRYLIVTGERVALRVALPKYGTLSLGATEASRIRVDHPEPIAFGLLYVDHEVSLQPAHPAWTRHGAPMRVGEIVALEVGVPLHFGAHFSVRFEVAARAQTAPSVEVEGLSLDSAAMKQIASEIDAAARSTHPVLVLGATGVGKSAIAQEIHERSRRGRFVKVHASELSAEAFTSAEGPFAEARDGTLLISELSALGHAAQLALARFLEAQEEQRAAANVRIIGECDLEIQAAVDRAQLRKDLYFRMRRLAIRVPLLRERAADVVPLARRFAGGQALSEEVERALQQYGWPGNVRELRYAIEYAATAARGGAIELAHLPNEVREAPPASLRDELALLERQRIIEALDAHETQADAARALGMPMRTFVNRLEAYNIPRARQRKE